MVHCPILLIKRKKDQGISITELLIVVAVIAILMVVLLAAFKPSTQLAKARDARRKSDLQKLKNPLEDYYNDKKCYPDTLGKLKPDYIGEVPVDPMTNKQYKIYTEGCDKYRIYAKLEFGSDQQIVQVGCGARCGPGGDNGTGDEMCAYNYGVCSSNTELEGCTAKCDAAFELDQPCLDNLSFEGLRDQIGQSGCCGENGPGNGEVACSSTECWCCPVD